MTAADILAEAAKLAAIAPRAERLPPRSDLDWKIDDAWFRLAFATSLESRLLWCSRFLAAKRERGDMPPAAVPRKVCHHESYATDGG